jgi:DNA-binding transcriptional regulator YhcF (GntR family)
MNDEQSGIQRALEALAHPIDRSSGLSIAAQLAWRLRTLIATEQLAPGARLPSARDVAGAAQVNVNTVFAVFHRLEEEGLIDSAHGRGSFVRQDVRGGAAVVALADELAASARAAGLDPRAVAMTVFATCGPPAGPQQPESSSAVSTEPAATSARSERRRLRDEIAALEIELSRLQPLTPARDAGRVVSPVIPDIAELRNTRDELRARVGALSAAAAQRRADARRRRADARRRDAPSAQSTTLDGTADRDGDGSPALPRVSWSPAWRPA